MLDAIFTVYIPFLLQYPLVFYHVYHQIFLQMTKSHILQHVFFFLVKLNISFILTCSNSWCFIYIIFYFKRSFILICRPYFNRSKFCISSFNIAVHRKFVSNRIIVYSFTVSIKPDDIYEDITEDVETRFDTSSSELD